MSTPPTVTVTAQVTVSNEASPGETISVAITDSTGAAVANSPFTGSTDANGNASIPCAVPASVGYTADATISSDSEFKGADSGPVKFDALASRTLSLSITPSP